MNIPDCGPVSASAICQAKSRLDVGLFRNLLYALDEEGSAVCGGRTTDRWKGRRLLAVDGAKINTRRSYELERKFGVPTGAHCPQFLMSTMVDVLSRTPLDFKVSSFRSSERDDLLGMLESTEEGDLILLDRGYPAHEVLQQLVAGKLDFVIRLPISNTFKAVDEIRASGKYDAATVVTPPEGSDPTWKPLPVRIVRIDGPGGNEDPNFYVTTLSESVASIKEIGELYHLRWESEEYFKAFTSEYIGQGQFRSKTARGVEQEVAALTLFLAMSRLLVRAATEKDDNPETFVSQKAAILTLQKYLVRMLLCARPELGIEAARRATERTRQTRDRRRPGRSHPRRSFKPRPKWNPRGRNGA